MTLRSGRESATKTPLLVALVAATKGATSDRPKTLKKPWSRATTGATKVHSGRLVSPPFPWKGGTTTKDRNHHRPGKGLGHERCATAGNAPSREEQAIKALGDPGIKAPNYREV